MRKGRMPAWVTLVLAAAGLLAAAIPGLWLLVSFTSRPLHPDARAVPSVEAFAPLPEWSAAVERARQDVLAHLIEENLPGLSVAVGVEGEVVWAEGVGFADLRSGVPVTPDHRFRIGTASMVLTSAAAGLLLEEGRLDFDAPIQTYVPEFTEKQQPVTLRQLMGHTSGLSSDGGDEGPLFAKHCTRPVEALKYFAKSPLQFQPGSRYRHSAYGWVLVSAAVERAAGQRFLTFMRERVFGPLGMLHTVPDSAVIDDDDFPLFNLVRELVFDPRAARGSTAPASASRPVQARATSYFPRFAADPNYGLHLMRPLDYSCYAGSGVFLSTPTDLVRYGMAVNGGRLLDPATVELLQTPQRLPSGETTGYGLGWDLETVTLAGRLTRMAGHDGDALGGTVASLLTFPDMGMSLAVASNISYADTYALGLKIAEAFAASGRISVRE